VGKMNVAENLHVSSTLEVRSLPTLILFKGGKPLEKVAGALPETKLKTMIKEFIQ
jgi:thioredoxin 1